MADKLDKDAISFWHVTQPEEWPCLNEYMSYSTLVSIEKCPRSWALKNSKYSFFNHKNKYPLLVTQNLMIGNVIHDSLDYIIQLFSKEGCISIKDPKIVSILKNNGGFTKIIEDKLEIQIEVNSGNLRFEKQKKNFINKIEVKIPEIRQKVQQIISRSTLIPRSNKSDYKKSSSKDNKKLSNGSYTEIGLYARDIKWYGKVDLLTIDNDEVTIIDYKSGNISDDHYFQIKLYNLLWIKDTARNPSGLLTKSLIVSYPTKDIVVEPLDIQSAKDFEHQLIKRSKEAQNQINNKSIPDANFNKEVCQYCDVRQLCDEYWKNAKNIDIKEILSIGFSDLEVSDLSQKAKHTWCGTINDKADKLINVMIHIQEADSLSESLLMNSNMVRLINCKISDYLNEENILVINISNNTENFVLDK